MKYAWIKKHKRLFPTAVMCHLLGVSRSGYYDSLKREPCSQQIRRRTITQAAARSYFENHRIYGYRKVYEDVIEQVTCCQETVRRVMRDIGLYSRLKRKFIVTTNSDHILPVAQNLLNRDFTADAPNQKWVADITYIPTRQGWLYLAVVLDLFSRRIVGWSMSDVIDSVLVQDALRMALMHRRPEDGLLHHSDRGVQYAAEDFQALLASNKIVCSMSRKGNCWDNAVAESFFGSLKNEWVQKKIYQTLWYHFSHGNDNLLGERARQVCHFGNKKVFSHLWSDYDEEPRPSGLKKLLRYEDCKSLRTLNLYDNPIGVVIFDGCEHGKTDEIPTQLGVFSENQPAGGSIFLGWKCVIPMYDHGINDRVYGEYGKYRKLMANSWTRKVTFGSARDNDCENLLKGHEMRDNWYIIGANAYSSYWSTPNISESRDHK